MKNSLTLQSVGPDPHHTPPARRMRAMCFSMGHAYACFWVLASFLALWLSGKEGKTGVPPLGANSSNGGVSRSRPLPRSHPNLLVSSSHLIFPCKPQQWHESQVAEVIITTQGSETLSALCRHVLGCPCPKAAANTFREESRAAPQSAGHHSGKSGICYVFIESGTPRPPGGRLPCTSTAPVPHSAVIALSSPLCPAPNLLSRLGISRCLPARTPQGVTFATPPPCDLQS